MTKQFEETFTHKTIEVEGVELHYVIGGAGEPLVLLHGGFQMWLEWKRIMPSLAEKYTVIVPDLPGLGKSKPSPFGYDQETVARLINGIVTQLGFKKILLAGHDIGAAIGYAYTAKYRDEVKTFAFLDMLLPGFGFEQAWVPQPQGHFLWFAALNSVPDVPEELVRGREAIYLKHILRGGFAFNSEAVSEEDFDEYVKAYSIPKSFHALCEYFRAMWTNAEQNKENAKHKLTIPVLAVGGAMSVGEMAANSMRAVAENVESAVIENCGHWLNDEKPDEVLSSLTEFFSKSV